MRPLVGPHIETLKAYVPGKPIEETEREYGLEGVIKLASNENPLGPSPRAVEAMQQAMLRTQLYPDGASFHLLNALAAHLDVRREELVAGSGSNELIELLIRTFMEPEDEALVARGSFPAYRISIQSHGRRFVEVPMRDGFSYDLPAMADALTPRTRIVFLANPDNPTGTAFGREAFEAFLTRVPADVLVVHDEAYAEFVDWEDYPTGLQYFRRHPNVVTLRTFSKIHGLAGIRLGYGVMDARRVDYLNRVRMPFNLTSLAQAAGVAALQDTEHVRRTRALNAEGLALLQAELPKLGARVPRSHANFVLADFGRPCAPLYEGLLRRGVIVRPMAGNGFPTCLRISVGTSEENARCIAALREVL
ncbi:MAG: histidinol-phosphate transaminase, partial [Myxococcaceae bacterium]|nr:histidinol-phosphate transaminase [Myxococcaceae bacterium]